MSKLPVDCLNEIFQCLKKDKITLHSCLLVNRLWCQVSVRILWENVLNYDTLISCFPNESKEILYKNGIITPTLTPKPPLFNYVVFIRSLEIDNIIKNIFKNYQSTTLLNLNYKKFIVVQEIYKLLNQISSLRELHFYSTTIRNITPTFCNGAKDSLKNLSKLSCRSDIYPEFFYQLSQICQNIQSLKIRFVEVTSEGLTDLISAQKNLKYLDMSQYYLGGDLTYIIPSLMKHSNTLIKLHIDELNMPYSFIAKFTNLRELVLSSLNYNEYRDDLKDFKTLQHVTFPQLQILKFTYAHPRFELLVKFLENNGKNLREFHVECVEHNNSLNLAIAKYCPNLRILYSVFKNNDLETLKMIFNNCQYLESIKVWSGYVYLETKELFEVLTKFSPKSFHELQLYPSIPFTKEDLEEFFINWKDRLPLSFIVFMDRYGLKENHEIMDVIEKYKMLGIVKKFETLTYEDDKVYW